MFVNMIEEAITETRGLEHTAHNTLLWDNIKMNVRSTLNTPQESEELFEEMFFNKEHPTLIQDGKYNIEDNLIRRGT